MMVSLMVVGPAYIVQQIRELMITAIKLLYTRGLWLSGHPAENGYPSSELGKMRKKRSGTHPVTDTVADTSWHSNSHFPT